MEEHGKVIQVLQVRSGQSTRTGEQWCSQGFVLQIDGRYERKVRLNLWGVDNIRAANLQPGMYITAKFDIEAHEHQGDWYNDCRVWDIEYNGQSILRRRERDALGLNNQAQYQQQANQPMNQYQPQQQQYQPAPVRPYTQQDYVAQQQQENRPW